MPRTNTIPSLKRQLAFVVLGCAAGALLSSHVTAKTFVLPHVLEKSGTINNSNTFDSQVHLSYVQGLLGGVTDPVNVSLSLYDGQTNALIAPPAVFTLNDGKRSQTIDFSTLIAAGGGFQGQIERSGYGVLTITGPGEDAVVVQGLITNAHTSPTGTELNIGGMVVDRDPPDPATRATWTFPHVLEKSGSVSQSDTFDTTVFMTYTPGLNGGPGPGATASLYLYDQSGSPMQNSTGAIANPVTVDLNAQNRKQSIRLDDLITPNGGFPANGVKLGFGVIVVGGADPDGVSVQSTFVNSHSNPADLATAGITPVKLPPTPTGELKKTFVIPHVLDTAGSINVENPASSDSDTFDTTIFVTYTPGLAGGNPGPGAQVAVTLYNKDGVSLGTETAQLTDAKWKESYRLDDFITKRGGYSPENTPAHVVAEVTGDTDGVALQGFVVNSHTGPFDLSTTPVDVQPVKDGGEPSPMSTRRSFVLPHVLETSGRITDPGATNVTDTNLIATYTGGHGGGGAGGPVGLRVLLFDAAGNELGPGASILLDADHPQANVSMEDLIISAGGFGVIQPAFALAQLDGDAGNVNLQGFVVNSHTGPFDLSVFGFNPEEVRATTVPEPSTLALGAMGLGALALYVRRRRSR